MQWIHNYQLFLFDLDGLLVDTEYLHYQAYLNLFSKHGYILNWDFPRYSEAAHRSSTALRDQLYQEFPSLKLKHPDWNLLYEEKKNIFLDLFHHSEVPLMKGAEALLLALEKEKIKRCVVTHSPNSITDSIRKRNPILNTIPHWITRENYKNAKPDPECYELAISLFAEEKDKIIGFEDSPRGFKALSHSKSKPILVCPKNSVYLKQMKEEDPNILYSPSLESDELAKLF